MNRLFRPKDGRLPGGVCAGVGVHPDIGPAVIRLIRVAPTLLSRGTDMIVCLVAWFLIPKEPGGETP